MISAKRLAEWQERRFAGDYIEPTKAEMMETIEALLKVVSAVQWAIAHSYDGQRIDKDYIDQMKEVLAPFIDSGHGPEEKK
jgi:hypothetical protein